MKALRCEKCLLLVGYVDGEVETKGDVLCLVCAYNDPKFKED